MRPSPSLLQHVTRNLRLTPVRAAALSLAVAEGSEQDQLRSHARAHFLRTVGEIVDALSQGGDQRQEAVNVSNSELFWRGISNDTG